MRAIMVAWGHSRAAHAEPQFARRTAEGHGDQLVVESPTASLIRARRSGSLPGIRILT